MHDCREITRDGPALAPELCRCSSSQDAFRPSPRSATRHNPGSGIIRTRAGRRIASTAISPAASDRRSTRSKNWSPRFPRRFVARRSASRRRCATPITSARGSKRCARTIAPSSARRRKRARPPITSSAFCRRRWMLPSPMRLINTPPEALRFGGDGSSSPVRLLVERMRQRVAKSLTPQRPVRQFAREPQAGEYRSSGRARSSRRGT